MKNLSTGGGEVIYCLRQFLASFLLLLLFTLPLGQAFAQEVLQTENPPLEASPTEVVPSSEPESPALLDILQQSLEEGAQQESLSQGESQDSLPQEQSLGEGGEMNSMLSGGAAESSQYPQSLSYQSSKPKVDLYTGALTQRIALNIPPGRNSVQPDVALEYNNQSTQDGLVGYGWNVSIPYIERLNKTGSEKLYTDNYFTSSFGGELASTSTSTPNEYRLKVEDGSFVKYIFENNAWVAYDKKGTKYTFGTTSQAQQSATTSPDKVGKWMLEEIRDTNNNFVRFEYLKESNQIYPYRIYYTGHNSSDGIFKIEFATSTRPDPYVSYRSGFKVTTNYRISEIKAYVNSDWVRKYTFSYITGSNGVRSLLQSVQETGRDSNNIELQLPATTFEYVNATTTIFVKPGSVLTDNTNIRNGAYVVSDTNGDGLSDVNISYEHYSDSYNPYASIYKNKGDGSVTFNQFNYPTSPFPIIWARNSPGDPTFLHSDGTLRFFDLDGDGKADIVRSFRGSDGNATTTFYRNNYSATSSVYSWVVASTTGVVPYFQYSATGSPYSLNTGLLGNLNGDSLTDYSAYLSGSIGPESYMGIGSGFVSSTTLFSAVKSMPSSDGSGASNSQLVDINGDNLDDWVWSDDSSTYVQLNNGMGWESSASSQWTLATSTYYHVTSPYSTYWDRGMRFLDINGDGLPDFVRSFSVGTYTSNFPGSAMPESGSVKQVFLNTGLGWATSTAYADLLPAYIMYDSGSGGSSTWSNDYAQYNEYANWNGLGQQKQDVLNKINYPTGGNTQVTYTQSALLGSNPELPASYLVVTKLINNDNVGIPQEIDYVYTGGKFYSGSNPLDQKFGGFSIITETRPDSILKSYYHQGDTASTTAGEQSDGFVLIGRMYRQDVLTPSTGNPLRKTFKKFETTDQGNGRTYVFLSKEQIQDFDSTGAHKDKATEYAYATSTGDVIRTVDLGEVAGNSDGTYSDTGSDSRTRVFSYAVATSTNISLPATEILANHASTTVREKRHYYDGLTLGSVGIGNETKEENWISGLSFASTTKAYDSFGNIASSTDQRGNVSSNVYDSYNLYVSTTTNALSQTRAATYDYATGKVLLSTDSNNLTKENVYDPVGRLIEEKIPDLTSPSTRVTKLRTAYTDTGFPTKQGVGVYLASATTSTTTVYFDGLGRKIQERLPAEGNNTTVVKSYLFGTNGLISQESLPFFASSTAWTPATTTASSLMTSYAYDALGRTTAVVNAVGTTTYMYGTWSTSKTDPRNNTTEYNYDAFENLIGVTEPGAAASDVFDTGLVGYWKLDEASGVREDSYASYDLTDNNTVGSATGKINTAGDFERSNSEYLSHSSALGLTNGGPRSGSLWFKPESTPSSGEYFTLLGSPRGGTTFNTYHQVYYRNDGGTPQLLVTRQSNNFQHIASYSVTLTTGTWYHIAFTYDGSMLRLYLNGEEVSNTTSTSAGSGDAGTGFTIGSNLGGDLYADGLIDEVGLWSTSLSDEQVAGLYNSGSGLEYGGDPLAGGGETVYAYDASNNLTGITDALDNVRNFTYDGLNRRISADDLHAPGDTTVGIWSYEYDAAGNVASSTDPKGQTVVYTYDALNRPLTENYTGQAGTEVTYAYDSCSFGVGRLCTASSTAASTTLTYDARGSVASEAKTINSTTYTTTYSRDRQGNPLTILYPNGAEVQYLYYDSGRVSAVIAKPNSSSSFATTTDHIFYAPTGQVTYKRFGNGVGTRYTFDSNELYRLTRLKTGAGDPANPTLSGMVTNLLGYWKMDEASGVREDSHGTYNLTNNNTVSSAAGKINNGADLENSNSEYLNNDTALGLTTTGQRSGSLWFKPESTPASGDLFTLMGGPRGGTNFNEYNQIYYQNDSGTVKLLATRQSGTFYHSASYTTTLTNGTWYHIAYTYDGTTLSLYVNGSEVASTTSTSTGGGDSGTGFTIGANWGGGLYTDGVIDEAALWSRALTAQEVSDLYNAGSGVSYGSFTGPTGIQDFMYEYDANGNILSIESISSTDIGKVEEFSYDALNRLTVASTTSATTAPYQEAYTYNKLGNLLIKTDVGTYTYSTTTYANPHAPTSIAGTSYAYDNNGNLLTVGSNISYSWDHRNRLIQSVISAATTTYQYDHDINRVSQATGSTTTSYPGKNYSIISTTIGATTTATTTAYIWLGDTLLSTINQVLINGSATGTPTINYMHSDHLGSTNVVTNASGTAAQALDYYPYGKSRVSTGGTESKRKYIGEFTDNSNLNYLNARYYEGSRGQFLSQDPMFWSQRQNILDPQSLNSYSYANGNPITGKDPLGLFNIKTGAVEKGDTLSAITSLLNITNGTSYSVNQVAQLNNIANPNRIYTGQTIMPNYSTPDVTRSLNSINQTNGAQAKGSTINGNTNAVSTLPSTGIGTVQFANNFHDGGKWDLKSQPGVFCQKNSCGGQTAENYVFNAQQIPGDAPGNIHYGYVGKETGYSLDTLLFFGSAVQVVTNISNFEVPTGDPASDRSFIIQGYGLRY